MAFAVAKLTHQLRPLMSFSCPFLAPKKNMPRTYWPGTCRWRRPHIIVCCSHWKWRTAPPWSRTSRQPGTVRSSPWLTSLQRPPHWDEDRGCTRMTAWGQMPQLSPSARVVVTGACTSRPPAWGPKRWWRKICRFALPGSRQRQLAVRRLSCVKTSGSCMSCSSSLHHFQRTHQVSRFPSWWRRPPPRLAAKASDEVTVQAKQVAAVPTAEPETVAATPTGASEQMKAAPSGKEPGQAAAPMLEEEIVPTTPVSPTPTPSSEPSETERVIKLTKSFFTTVLKKLQATLIEPLVQELTAVRRSRPNVGRSGRKKERKGKYRGHKNSPRERPPASRSPRAAVSQKTATATRTVPAFAPPVVRRLRTMRNPKVATPTRTVPTSTQPPSRRTRTNGQLRPPGTTAETPTAGTTDEWGCLSCQEAPQGLNGLNDWIKWMIIKARNYLNRKGLLTLYYTFVYPYLTYCNHIWGNIYQSNLKHLCVLQYKIVRIIAGVKPRESTGPLYDSLGIMKLTDLNKYLIARFMFRYCTNMVPKLFSSYFLRNYNVSSYNLRSANSFHLPLVATDLGKNGIRYRGPIVFNKLLIDGIDCTVSEAVFVNQLKRSIKTGKL